MRIAERYRTWGLLPHVEQTFMPFAERFLPLATIDRLFAYGQQPLPFQPSSTDSARSF